MAATHAGFFLLLAKKAVVSPDVMLQATQFLAAALILPPVTYVLIWAIGGYVTVFRKWDWCDYVPLMVVGLMIHASQYIPGSVMIVLTVLLMALAIIAVWWRMDFVLKEVPAFHLTTNIDPTEMRKTTPTYEVLHPQIRHKVVSERISRLGRRTWAYGLLLFVWLTLVPWSPHAAMLLPAAAVLMGLLRVVAYRSKQSSHLGFTARWATGHFIVPEFDKVWLIPFCMVGVSGVISVATEFGLLPLSIGCALSIVVPAVMATTCGPNYEAWTLTAPVRYPRHKTPQPHNKKQSLKTA